MKDVYAPSKPIDLVMNEALKTVWQGCGHQLVNWAEELTLSSKVTKWQLDVKRSLMKGWDLTAVIEVELTPKG